MIRDSEILSRNPNYRPTKYQYWDFQSDRRLLQLISFCDPFKSTEDTFEITIEAINLTNSIPS